MASCREGLNFSLAHYLEISTLFTFAPILNLFNNLLVTHVRMMEACLLSPRLTIAGIETVYSL